MKIRPEDVTPYDAYQLMLACIAPRPIALVSTVGPDGRHNLAPFSFFSGLSSEPPTLTLGIGHKDGGERKDTQRNIEATREFVVNVVTEPIAKQMVLCSGEYPYGQSEFEIAKLTPVPSEIVKPPRVAESPVQMECKLLQIVDVPGVDSSLIIGQILLFHVADRLLAKPNRIDIAKLRPLGRLNGDHYATLGDILTLPRPRL